MARGRLPLDLFHSRLPNPMDWPQEAERYQDRLAREICHQPPHLVQLPVRCVLHRHFPPTHLSATTRLFVSRITVSRREKRAQLLRCYQRRSLRPGSLHANPLPPHRSTISSQEIRRS